MNVRAGNLIVIRVVAAALKKVQPFAVIVKVIIGCIMKLMRGGGDILRAYKCDRCGSHYDKFTYSEINVYLVHGDKSTIDLCPECVNELSKWYKNEQVQKDIPECKYCKWTGSPESLGKCKTCICGSNFEVSEAFTPVDSEKGSEDKV